MPGINVLKKYFGYALMYSIYHIEDDELAYSSHPEECGTEAWYVCSPLRMKALSDLRLATG